MDYLDRLKLIRDVLAEYKSLEGITLRLTIDKDDIEALDRAIRLMERHVDDGR